MAPTRPGGKGKRGRPRKSVAQSAVQKRGRPSKQTASKDKSAGRKSTRTRNQEADEDATSRREAPPLKRKRNVREVEDEELDEIAADAPAASAATSAPVRPKYVSLVPKTRRLPQATIEKWPLVSAPVVEQIRILLGHAKDAVALSRRDSQKQAEADELLNGVIHQLGRHFSVMKVPPRAKAQHFDIDQLTTRNERLLYALTTERDKNKLLKDKTEKTQAQLSSEEETLNATKANAQSWQRAWKSQEKKQLHPLLRDSEDVGSVTDRPDDIGLKKYTPVDTAGLDTPDDELAPLLERLRRNLETMQGNHAQIDGIDEAVRHAQAALDDIIFKHSGAQQVHGL